MIWVRGEIVPDEVVRVSILDRTFEHGLGLFETFRTWNGHATLLDRHLARLIRSAVELRLPLRPAIDLPDAEAVAALRRANGYENDALLRITMSGGLSETECGVVWMRARPLPSTSDAMVRIRGRRWSIERDESLSAYKTLNYWRKRRIFERAQADGYGEALGKTPDGAIREGTRTNLFLVRHGGLKTPTLEGFGLPGIMREIVMERARHLEIEVQETMIDEASLEGADEVFLTNSVRGLLPVAEIGSRRWDAPGPLTRQLQEDILRWLFTGGKT